MILENSNSLVSSNKIAAFVHTALLERYDSPVPIPKFHKEIWEACTSGAKRIVIAAPRRHAKSTAVTHALTLYLFLFRLRKYGIIVSDTEGQASQFLGDIKAELLGNENVRSLFGIKKLLKDAITDIIVEFDDGEQFRIQSIGSEQKIRGRKWNNIRPDYIVCDDLENDELVSSDDRRAKFRDWFYKALLPSLSKTGIIIVVGTIPHMDSIMVRLQKNKAWKSLFYTAHKSFNDFSNILWSDQWSEKELKEEQQSYINDGIADGYAQEYLNDPISHSEAFFKLEDFKEMEDEMYHLPTTNYAAIDFAISDQDKSAYTVIAVGGMDQSSRLFIKHILRMRGDANDICDAIFEIQRLYGIEMWKMEQGQIKLTLMGELHNRMNAKGIYLNISPGVPTKDKRSRARAIQARMRAGGVWFDKKAEWYPALEQEFLHFPKGLYKDQVDAISWLGIMINEMVEGPTTDELEEEEYNNRMADFDQSEYMGQNPYTGY